MKIISFLILALILSLTPACAGGAGIKETKTSEVSLRVAVYNDTEINKPDLEIWIKGTGSWYPDEEGFGFGGDVFIPTEPFSTEEVNEIYIYPDGREGNEIVVEIIATNEMIAESVRDTIHVEIHDETVKVWGAPIEEHEKEFKR
jgi:cold shock CspA family protein